MVLKPHTLYILVRLNPVLREIRKGSEITVTYHELNKPNEEVNVRVADVDHTTGRITGRVVAAKGTRGPRVAIAVMDRDLRVVVEST